MKLPEIDSDPEEYFQDCTEFEIAQLHCLRSIAVNLEVLAICHLNEHKKNPDRVKAAKFLRDHSVIGA